MAGIPPRVVFIPGIMGSVLWLPQRTEGDCRDMVAGSHLTTIASLLAGTFGLVWSGVTRYSLPRLLCGAVNPKVLWGTIDMLPWLFDAKQFMLAMQSGNGLNDRGGVEVVPGRQGLVKILDKFDPYTGFMDLLESSGVDLLVFTYDWRLSNVDNAARLSLAIHDRWFKSPKYAKYPPPDVPPEERVTIIAHSMGGLLARYYIENNILQGWRRVRRLITAGTPHLGAPVAYSHFVGYSAPFSMVVNTETIGAMIAGAAGSATQVKADLADLVLPTDVQQELFQSFASAAELMPICDFCNSPDCTDRGWYGKEYLRMFHKPTGRNVGYLLSRFRDPMVPPGALDHWVNCHSVEYYLIGEADLDTIVDIDRGGQKPIYAKAGDSTTPLRSAQSQIGSNTPLYLQLKTLKGGEQEHMNLFRHPVVQAYCLDKLLGRPTTNSIVGLPKAVAAALPDPKTSTFTPPAPIGEADREKSLLTLAKEIKAAQGRDVLCVIRLVLRDAPDRPLLDLEFEPGSDPKKPVLKKAPPGVTGKEVEVIDHLQLGVHYYLWLQSNEKSQRGVGGVLFLPAACQDHLDLLTWNTGSMEDKAKSCANDFHAEMHLDGWLRKQEDGWRARISRIEILNRSSKRGRKGYSPCRPCCSDLGNMAESLHLPSDVAKCIGWKEIYDKRKDCDHPTTRDALRLLKKWEVDGGSPMPPT